MTTRSFFDSLTHITADGSWFGERNHDASLTRLLADMDAAGVRRACLVNIADYGSNEVTMDAARNHPDRFVPVAGINPAKLPTLRRVEAVVESTARQGFAGIKLHPRLNGYDPLDAKCVELIALAAKYQLVVFLDTLFRRKGISTTNAADTIDEISNACPDSRIILLHSAGPQMLELFEIVRANPNLLMDFSFSIMRYAGSRLDDDMKFLFQTTDQLITIGSDFPEYSIPAVKARFELLTEGIEPHRIENIAYRNLERLFDGYHLPG